MPVGAFDDEEASFDAEEEVEELKGMVQESVSVLSSGRSVSMVCCCFLAFSGAAGSALFEAPAPTPTSSFDIAFAGAAACVPVVDVILSCAFDSLPLSLSICLLKLGARADEKI